MAVVWKKLLFEEDIATPNWLGTWSKRIRLIIDHNDIDDALTDFPILIHLSTSSGRNNNDVSCVFDELENDANRKKIAVTTSDGLTECYVEIEKWDDANEKAWLWVKVPSVSKDDDTVLYLYYDKDHADNTAYVGDPDSVPAETVWGSDCVFVSHMRDDPDNEHIRDSSEYDGDGTKGAAGEPTEAAAEVMGGVQDFDGDDYVTIADAPRFSFGNGVTDSPFSVRCWVLSSDVSGGQMLISKDSSLTVDPKREWYLSLNAGKVRLVLFDVGYRGREFSGAINVDTLYLLMATYDGNQADPLSGITVYKNGVAVDDTNITAAAYTAMSNLAADVLLGCKIDAGGNRANFLAGSLGLSAIYSVELSAAWAKACYESETDDLLDFGSEAVGTRPPAAHESTHVSGGSDDIDSALADAAIPNLAASKITSERFPVDRLPAMTDEYYWVGTGAGNVEERAVPSVVVAPTSGSYTGNDTVNRAIPHGLGAAPALILIHQKNGDPWGAIVGEGSIMYILGGAQGEQAVTNPNNTNFYVGNAANYQQSCNADGHVYYWVAIL